MSDFWVGDYRVDVSRGRVVAKDRTVSLEPRVLRVLLALAETPGEVVTHQALLEKVWPNVVVEPNALQRCIGQLRKAFEDDAKQQKVIVTHPKTGYSLVANIKNITDNSSAKEPRQFTDNTHSAKGFLFGAALLFLGSALYVMRYLPSPDLTSPPMTQLSRVTSTDEKEYYPSFSPDGRYLIFNRFVAACENQLWVKDLQQNRTFQFIEGSGFFGPAAWSPDGSQIAFSNKHGCDGQQQIKRCRSINTASFFLAQAEPQKPRELLSCKESDYGAIQWLTDNKIAFIDFYAQQGEVKSFSFDNGQVDLLYSDKRYDPQALSYSGRNRQLAITVHDATQASTLALLDTESGNVEYKPFIVPETVEDYSYWDPVWHPTEDKLLTSAHNSLFEISMSGVFTEYPVLTVASIYNPTYHPSGNKIVAAMGAVDLDIHEYSFQHHPLTHQMKVSADESEIIHQSTVADHQAKYQTATHSISFVSSRSGEDQIWLSENGELTQLSLFEPRARIDSYAWSPDGRLMALAINGVLRLLMLDGQAQPINTPFKVIDVYQWVNEQQVLLSVIESNSETPRKVVLFDISKRAYSSVYQGYTDWAQLHEGHSLFYTNKHKQLHLYQGNQSIVLPSMAGVMFSSGFMIKENQLILVGDKKVWFYGVENNKLLNSNIPAASRQATHLDDVDYANRRLLLSVYKEARKDLMMFQRKL